MKPELTQIIPMAEAFSRLLHPFAEVVIHDLESDEIQMIYNSFSKREAGDKSYMERWDFAKDPQDNVYGPYEKLNYDGRKLKSVSIVIRDLHETAVGFLCVNMDISVFESQHQILMRFLGNNDADMSEETQGLFKDDLYEQINMFVQDYCRAEHLSLESLSREDKQYLVHMLKQKGAFNGKNATNYIARILTISRATVYNYLKESEG